ncbi:MAG: hypothetical protein GY777_31715 [Candidatus Brocadiaceae bacterium]|nr:hypothetical protein [Candidatus Brocadiaceae bacterium]
MQNTIVRSVKVAPSVSMGKPNMTAGRDVEVDVIVHMGKKKGVVRIVMEDSSAKPHTVLPEKIPDIMDTVGFALPICFRISLWYGGIGQMRTLL